MAGEQAIATAAQSGLGDEPVYAFGRERRMHARAYDYWVSLLCGRRMPCLSDIEPARLDPFADRSVMVDLDRTGGAPVIAQLGGALRDEGEIAADQPVLADVPQGTLLSELLRRFPDIVAHQAPVGLEAECTGRTGNRLLYRGILLPFADEQGRLASIYGVMSWRQAAAVQPAPDIVAAVSSAMATRAGTPLICAWGDGPGATLATTESLSPQSLEQRLDAARTWAALAEADRTHSNASLHAALGGAYDYLLAARDDSLTTRKIIRMVFGEQLRPLDRMRYIFTLDHARRLGLGQSRMPAWLDGYGGGHVAIAIAERKAKRAERAGETGQIIPVPMDPMARLNRLALSIDDDVVPLTSRRIPRGFGDATPLPEDHRLTGTG